MERLKDMKRALVCCAESQINGNLANVDTKELGEVIDMIKDLEEAIYYCTVTEAMEENYPSYEDRTKYYNDKMEKMHFRNRQNYYSEEDLKQKDRQEGRSPAMRKTYMESKELKHSKEHQMKELEKYMRELTNDILEMIEDASPEEKAMLSQKLTTLAGNIH